jgi:hypothetical protein
MPATTTILDDDLNVSTFKEGLSTLQVLALELPLPCSVWREWDGIEIFYVLEGRNADGYIHTRHSC